MPAPNCRHVRSKGWSRTPRIRGHATGQRACHRLEGMSRVRGCAMCQRACHGSEGVPQVRGHVMGQRACQGLEGTPGDMLQVTAHRLSLVKVTQAARPELHAWPH